MTTTLTTHRPKVAADRIIDHDTQHVAVTLTEDTLADDILYGLVSTLRGCPNLRARFVAQLAGTRALTALESAELRHDIARAMSTHDGDHFELDVDEAEDLAEQLEQATEDAPECVNVRCANLADIIGGLCAACEDGLA